MNGRQRVGGRLRGLRVLIAEDDYSTAHMLSVRLEEEGARVVGPAGSLRKACELLGSEAVDFAVIDIILRDVPADMLLGKMAEQGVPHAVITGYGALPTNAPDSALRVFSKPIPWESLVELLLPFARN